MQPLRISICCNHLRGRTYLHESHCNSQAYAEIMSMSPFHRKDEKGQKAKNVGDQGCKVQPVGSLCSLNEACSH